MEGGAWGIVIVASAFMIQVLTFGTTASVGVYNIELLDHFHNNTVGVSLIGSINFGVYLGSGPIVSYLMTRYSYRKIALLGSALVTLGLIGMPYYPYIPTMCLLFGVLTGFGNCCTYIPSHVLSGLYYAKYRSIATGVSTSGSGLGAAVLPVLVGFLIDVYSWRGSLIFVAGLNLHLFIFAALLRYPSDVSEVSTTIQADSTERIRNSSSSVHTAVFEQSPPAVKNAPSIKVDPLTSEHTCLVTPKKLRGGKSGSREKSVAITTLPREQRERPRSNAMSGSESYHGKTEYENVGVNLSTKDRVGKCSMKTDHNSRGKIPLNLRQSVSINFGCSIEEEQEEENGLDEEDRERDSGVVVEEAFSNGQEKYSLRSKQKMSLGASSIISEDRQRLSLVQFLPLPHSTSSRSLFALGSRGSTIIYYEPVPNISGMQTSMISQSSAGVDSFAPSVDSPLPLSSRHIYIFTNYGFNIYFLSNIMWNASYAITQSFAPEFLQERGMTLMGAAWLSGAFGLSSFVGGVVGGVIGNIDGVDRQRLYRSACVLMGVAILVFPQVNQVEHFAAALVVAGLALGIILGLLIVVLTDLVGAESLGNGLGYLMLSNGMGTFLGPPMASILKDGTGGFKASMQLAGALSVLGGFIMLLMPCKRCCCCSNDESNSPCQAQHTSGGRLNDKGNNPCCKKLPCHCIRQPEEPPDAELVPL